MKLLYVSLLCVLKLVLIEGLKCGDIVCPAGSSSCNVNYSKTSASKSTMATVNCYDNKDNIVHTQTYDSITKQLQLPVPEIKCGNFTCKPGAYSCLSSTETSYSINDSKKVTHLMCYDGEGTFLEKQSFVSPVVFPPSIKIPPPSCDGYTCPEGSGKCISEVTLSVQPTYKKNTHITCYDFENNLLKDVKY